MDQKIKSNESIAVLFRRLWGHLSLQRRKQFLMLLILMLLASFSEILSIGAVLPFLGVLTSPEHVFEMRVAQPLIQTFRLTEVKQLILPLTIAFGVAALTAGAMRLLLLWVSTRLSFAAGADLSMSMYRRTLYQPYVVHCGRNSSQVIDGISGKANGIIYSTIVPAITLISSSVMLIAITLPILILQPIIALVALGGFGFIYIIIARLTRKKLLSDSECVARESTQVIKSLQEGLGGIRDVLVDGSQEFYCQIYRNADSRLRRAQGSSLFISASPRYVMEALGMLLIAALAYSLARHDGISEAIPFLGLLALGAQRSLPVLQQAYSAWAQINSGQASLRDSLELLDQPLPGSIYGQVSPLPFNRSIAFRHIGFKYEEQGPYVLKQLNLNINKGARIGFIGVTGSGKSTLLDIAMGLLEPTEGCLEIDDQIVTPENNHAWRARIAHVPQSIFLGDCSIEENIAIGVPKDKIDPARVMQAAQKAQIAEIIESWPMQYKTFVGERGVRLSGGQRQRIGIARALYRRADVLIFDEATSALDNETELAVMKAIEALSKDLTILIIAHRLTTLRGCTKIVELGDGGIKRIGSYGDIVNLS